MAANKFSLFGFSFSRNKDQDDSSEQSFSPPANDDGALTITSAAYYGTYVDMDGTAKNEVELISRYREMAMQPEIESALDDIVNEAISQDDDGRITEIVLDSLKQPEKIKKAIRDEFETILRLLNYKNMAQDIFRRYYIDGKMYYHIIVDKDKPTEGIKELRYIDPRKLKKVREIKKRKDERTGVDVMNVINEYYIFNDKVVSGTASNYGPVGVRITTDSIINVVSGLMDSRRAVVLSYLHKAIKPLNQLRMIEDATVIYRISRAPERRIFYIDVGNLPKLKAEQYLRDIMAKYKNKLVYDAQTGEIRDDRKFMSMMEDFWLPRREGGRGTEITTLPGGQNLGELADIEYFQKKLYRALGVPESRIASDGGFNLGRSSEILRDELKFAKFVGRLRKRFANMFNDMLRTQLILKNIVSPEDWETISDHIQYDFLYDNQFAELKESELMNDRLATLATIEPYIGKYYSTEYVRKKILRQTDSEIIEIDEQIEDEIKKGIIPDPSQVDPITGEPLPPEGAVPQEGGDPGLMGNVPQEPDINADAQITQVPEPKGGKI